VLIKLTSHLTVIQLHRLKIGTTIICCAIFLSFVATAQTEYGQPRIVTLTPHATELVFAAGGGQHIVATVQASDFPASVQPLPKVGSGLGVEVEPIIAQNPTLIVGWPSPLLDRLQSLGFKTFATQPKSLDDIPNEIDALGKVLHTETFAQTRSANLRKRIQALPHLKPKSPLKVAILADLEAGYAIGGEHILNDVLLRCGAVNVFAQQPAAAPLISAESLWATQPDLIIVGQTAQKTVQLPPKLAHLKAKVLTVNADALFRPGPRFIDAAETICNQLQQATQ
jgi:iron complex transport system substrate-binding protein/vitamin B12 transport system substrate-binding protein